MSQIRGFLHFCNKSGVWFYIFVKLIIPSRLNIMRRWVKDYATFMQVFSSWVLPPRCIQSHPYIQPKNVTICILENALFISLSGFTAKSRCITLITSRCITLITTRCMIKYSCRYKPMHKVTYGDCLLYYVGLLFATKDVCYSCWFMLAVMAGYYI